MRSWLVAAAVATVALPIASADAQWVFVARKAAQRIHRAITEQRKIVVYGDYDADGMTAAALLCSCLRLLGAKFDYYVPDRLAEGYGLNCDALAGLAARGALLGHRRAPVRHRIRIERLDHATMARPGRGVLQRVAQRPALEAGGAVGAGVRIGQARDVEDLRVRAAPGDGVGAEALRAGKCWQLPVGRGADQKNRCYGGRQRACRNCTPHGRKNTARRESSRGRERTGNLQKTAHAGAMSGISGRGTR